jgi:signal transduction histidine kinase
MSPTGITTTLSPREGNPGPLGSRSAASALARRRRLAFRAIGVVAIVAAGLSFVMASAILTDHSDDSSRREAAATRALIEAGRRLRDQIAITLDRSMERLRGIAAEPGVREALRTGDRAALFAACNAAVRDDEEVDAVALFDAHGAIVAINSIYADGSAISANRIERVMGTDFGARRIVSGCLENRSREEALEFQTDCDITPALFDSAGLAVALSAPVYDERAPTQLGVVSVRLRFERIAAIAVAYPVAQGEGEVRFVTDAGAFFDEAVSAGLSDPPIPADELRTIVAALVTEGNVHSFVQREDGFIGLFRMDRYRTLEGGGIQVLVSLPHAWVARQTERERLREAAVPGFVGLLLVAVGVAHAMLAALIAKRAKLRELSERYEAAVAGTSDGLWEWEIESDALWTSPRCRDLLGEGSADGDRSLRWHDLLARANADDRQSLETAVTALLGQGKAIDIELRLRVGAGGERWFRLRGDVERSAERTRRIAGSIEDVTLLRQAVESLRAARADAEAANRSKSEFLANMSHEIRTPMTAILGFTELLASEGDRALAPQRRLEYIETIQRNGEHLLSIINDILDLSKIEAGRMTVESVDCDLAELLSETLALMAVRATAKGLALSASFETPVPASIRSDPVRLRQILVNLIGNAIKFTESGGVRVAVSIDQQREALLRFDVIDTGIGLSDAQRSKLFGTFAQADASITRRFGGTGLGLRISKRLAPIAGRRHHRREPAGTREHFQLCRSAGCRRRSRADRSRSVHPEPDPRRRRIAATGVGRCSGW